MSELIQRAQLLMDTGRYEQAEEVLGRALLEMPDEPWIFAFLAACRQRRGRLEEAEDAARQAIVHDPDFPFGHYVLASVKFDQHRLDEAEREVREAIRLDPTVAGYFSLLAGVHFSRKQWKEALAAANEGLARDPEHEGSLNLRAQAQIKLGLKQEAAETMREGLAQHPDAAFTHANQGWILLETGDAKGALHHFEEALRLDPTLDWAREGVVTALKAQHSIYRWILRFTLWMSRFSSDKQWLILIGGFIGYRLLQGWGKSHPEHALVVTVLSGLYVLFAVLTWTADPLFNLVLRFNRYGRLLLTPREVLGSNLFGGLLLGAAAFGALFFVPEAVIGERLHKLTMYATMICLGMCIPVAATFNTDVPKAQAQLGRYTAVLGALAVGFVGLYLLGSPLAGILGLAIALGLFVFQFYANGVMMRGRA